MPRSQDAAAGAGPRVPGDGDGAGLQPGLHQGAHWRRNIPSVYSRVREYLDTHFQVLLPLVEMKIAIESKLFAFLKNLFIIDTKYKYRWTEDEKEENNFCLDGMTFIDKDGMTHCMNKNSDNTVEVKCVDDEEEPVTDPPEHPVVPGDGGMRVFNIAA